MSIVRRILFTFFVLTSCVFSSVEDKANAELERFACIQLMAYDAQHLICDRPHDCACVPSVEWMTMYEDQHGLGKTFQYMAAADPELNQTILSQVVQHKKENFSSATKDDERNTLFVRMQYCLQSPDGHIEKRNVYLGLFVSGREPYYTGPTMEQLFANVPQSATASMKGAMKQHRVDLLTSTSSSFHDSLYFYSQAKPAAIKSRNDAVFLAKTGPKKAFICDVGQGKMRFIMHSGSACLDDEGDFVKNRLAPKIVAVGRANPLALTAQHESIVYNLFGRLRYDEYQQKGKIVTPCFKKEPKGQKIIGLGHCFFDSEQTFLSLLEQSSDIPEMDFPLPEGEGYVIKGIGIHCYSFRDMCRFCRGTLSHMLFTGALKENVVNFLTNKFDSAKFRTGDGEVDLKLFVYSYEKTSKV